MKHKLQQVFGRECCRRLVSKVRLRLLLVVQAFSGKKTDRRQKLALARSTKHETSVKPAVDSECPIPSMRHACREKSLKLYLNVFNKTWHWLGNAEYNCHDSQHATHRENWAFRVRCSGLLDQTQPAVFVSKLLSNWMLAASRRELQERIQDFS